MDCRLPCPSPSPGVCLNSCPLSWWCHPIISSSAVPFFSCLQFFPAPESFPVNRFFASGGQSIGVSASASVLPVNTQGWFPVGLDWLVGSPYREIQESFKSLLQHHSLKASVLRFSAFFMDQLSHLYMTTRKTIALITGNFVGKVVYLLFNMLREYFIY